MTEATGADALPWTIGILVLAAVLAYVLGWPAFALRRFDEVFAWAYGGERGQCPHADCFAVFPQPAFACVCGSVHHDLRPRRAHLLYRWCACNRWLPTLYALGKGRLPTRCPRCERSVPPGPGACVHIPIYGGVSSGKTTYMISALYSLLEGKLGGVKAEVTDPKGKRRYDRIWKPDFLAGRVREKSPDVVPSGLTLRLWRSLGPPMRLFLYDPAGEAFDSEAGLAGHSFLEVADGLILLFDPLALPAFRKRYEELNGRDLSSTTTPISSNALVTRLINAVRPVQKGSVHRAMKTPLAVVFTKSDIPEFMSETGAEVPITAGSVRAQSARLRAWLEKNEPHLLNLLTTQFGNIRFFAVSALGHAPDRKQRFEPKNVLQPVTWLLGRQPSFQRPFLSQLRSGTALLAGLAVVMTTTVIAPAGFAYVGADRAATAIVAYRRQVRAEQMRQAHELLKQQQSGVEEPPGGPWSPQRDLAISQQLQSRGVVIALEDVQVEGDLRAVDIEAVLDDRQRRNLAWSCYYRFIDSGVQFSAKIRFDISRVGKVNTVIAGTQVQIGSGPDLPLMNQRNACARKILDELEFPPPADGEPAWVIYRFRVCQDGGPGCADDAAHGRGKASTPEPVTNVGMGALGQRIDLGSPSDGQQPVRVMSGRSAVKGSLTKAEVARPIRRNLARFKFCYQKRLRSNPYLRGKVSVSFTITPNGTVSRARVRETSVNDTTVEECVIRVLKSLEFPRPKGGGSVTVTYPLVFATS